MNINVKSILLLMITICCNDGICQEASSSASLVYLIRQPKVKSEKPPLLFLIHGFAANEFDLFSFADQLPDRFLVISVRAPNTVDEGRYSWYKIDPSSGRSLVSGGEEKKSREIVIQFIENIKRQFKVDDQQIYLCGFSQGAMMSFSVGLTQPDLIKGIAVMSGRLIEQIKPDIAEKKKLELLHIFITHGIKDQQVEIQEGRNSKAYLESIGLMPVYKEYPDGHTISKKMLTDLSKWLNQSLAK